MRVDNELKNRIKIVLTGTKYIATFDGKPLIIEDLKESDVFKKYAESRWVRRILKSNTNLNNYDIRILYALDELNWQAKMSSNPNKSNKDKNGLDQVDFTALGRAYIKELSRGTRGRRDAVPFQIEYDLNDTKELSKLEKISFYKTAKNHENIATIIKRKHISLKDKLSYKKEYSEREYKRNRQRKIGFLKRIATISAAAFSLIAGTFGLKSPVSKLNTKTLGDGTKYTQAIDSVDNKTSELTLETKAEAKAQYTTTTKSNSWSIPSNKLAEIENKTEDIIKENQKRMNVDINKQEEQLCLGTILQGLPENFAFQEGVDGGTIGNVGNSASPTNGFYVIDHSCKKGDNEYIIKQGLDGTLIDSKWGHISLVKADTLEEAQKIIKENKESKKMDNRIEPRGWVKMSDLENINKIKKQAPVVERES